MKRQKRKSEIDPVSCCLLKHDNQELHSPIMKNKGLDDLPVHPIDVDCSEALNVSALYLPLIFQSPQVSQRT